MLLLLHSNDEDFESLFDALRMFLRSLDFTFNELPVDNFVIVTEPIDDPVLAPGELGSLESRPFEDELEVTVEEADGLSDPEDGRSLGLDACEWTVDEEVFDEDPCKPEDPRSLLLTGDMVTPSFLPHFVGVPAVDPNSLPIASSTLSLLESLFGLNKCLLLLPSLVLETFLYALEFADACCDSLSVCFEEEPHSLLLSCSDTLESLTLLVSV
jgi:hypothetical protein